MPIGIELLDFYVGQYYVDIRELFEHRNLDMRRFDNLIIKNKSVALPCEDAITNAVNASKKIIDQMSDSEKESIHLLIVATESGIDFGKSIGTYIHHYLNLNKNCRQFEIKQACYAGTAALQMAVNFIASKAEPGAKALIIATDATKAMAKYTYAEPSQGHGAVAFIVSDNPKILEIDFGANGHYSYEVMDTCRPDVDVEAGDPDISLLSYLECMHKSYENYAAKVNQVDICDTFDYLVFHTPFGGMVKGAHRDLIRVLKKMPPDQIELDFKQRVFPSLLYCSEVGNIYSATIFLAFLSLVDNANFIEQSRVGFFSYGSGCSSEFYSGVINEESVNKIKNLNIKSKINNRLKLTMQQYDAILTVAEKFKFGIQNHIINLNEFNELYNDNYHQKNLLFLDKINNYHREYSWS